MGALIGGAYASGKLDAVKTWALSADRRVVSSMVDVSLLAGGLLDGVRIMNWLGLMGLTDSIEDLEVPFGAVATDLTTGREVWLQTGSTKAATRASIGLPGIFSPVEVAGRWLVDGGLVNPVPVSLCRAMGADFVIAVNLNEDLLGRRLTELADAGAEGPLGDTSQQNILAMLKSMPTALRKQAESFRLFGTQGGTPGYFDVLANSINIMHDHITRSRLAGEPPHVQIAPRVAEIGLMDFHRAEAIIVEGRLAAELSIPIIKAMLMA